MIAKQYIYTMCKNREGGGVAYKVYSVSQGITEEECEEIKYVMEYKAPKQFEMLTAKRLEELENSNEADKCPYAFGYFILSTGRHCIALSTYLSQYIELEKDHRFGNYIIHALIVEKEELDSYPVELFGEKYFKKNLSLEELNVPVPVPPLPEIQITDTGSIINDESIAEFLEDKEVYFSYLIAAAMEAKERNISLFINDTRENIVMWMAALQKLLPLKLANQISFITYTYNHTKYNGVIRKKDILCVGIRPDAMSFDYAFESNNSTQITVDFLGKGSKTESITITPYAHAMAEKFIDDMDEIEEFKEFLLKTDITTFTAILNEAYQFYEFLNSQFRENNGHIVSLLEFADRHCNTELNEQTAVELLENRSLYESYSVEQLKSVLAYICKYAGYMTFKVFDFVDSCFWKFLMSDSHIQDIQWLEQTLIIDPKLYKGYLTHFAEAEQVEKIREDKLGKLSLTNKLALLKFIFIKYSFTEGLSDKNPLTSCIYDILHTVKESGDVALIVRTLEFAQKQEVLVSDVLLFLCSQFDESKLQKLLEPMKQWMDRLDKQLQNHIMELLASTSELEGFLKEMHRIQIQTSENAEADFWNIYNQYYKGRPDVQIDKLVAAYLQKEKTLSNVKTVIRILNSIPSEQCQHPGMVKCMLECLETTSFKELNEMHGSEAEELNELLVWGVSQNKLVDREISQEFVRMDKILLIWLGKLLELNTPLDLEIWLSYFKNNITVLEPREEKMYLAQYFQSYFRQMRDRNHMELLIRVLCNTEKPSDFFNYFIKACKNESRKQTQLYAELCIVAVQGTLADSVRDYIKSLLKKELCNCGEQDTEKIRQLVITECGERGRQFLDDLQQSGKKRILNKLNDLFK